MRNELGLYRRVVDNKGTVVLAALPARVGTAGLYRTLAATAGRHVSTTPGLLAVVGEERAPLPAPACWPS